MSHFDQFATHRRSRRLPEHDYSASGWYFVTICTDRRRHLFGEIRRGVMGLNAVGCVAHSCLLAIPDHFPRAVLDAVIVMPNHVHAVIGIAALCSDSVPTGHAPSLQSPTLGSVVGSYKSAVTRAARKIDPSFGWQSRFHDHVVRNERALDYIRRYVANNPASWGVDRLNTRCGRPVLSTPSSP